MTRNTSRTDPLAGALVGAALLAPALLGGVADPVWTDRPRASSPPTGARFASRFATVATW